MNLNTSDNHNLFWKKFSKIVVIGSQFTKLGQLPVNVLTKISESYLWKPWNRTSQNEKRTFLTFKFYDIWAAFFSFTVRWHWCLHTMSKPLVYSSQSQYFLALRVLFVALLPIFDERNKTLQDQCLQLLLSLFKCESIVILQSSLHFF